jgi:hypothetical protein
VCLAYAGTGVGTAHAVNLLVNPSFETGHPGGDPSYPVGSTGIPGWTVNGGGDGVAWITSPDFGITADDGIHSLDLTGYSNGVPYGGVQQDIVTITGATYHLSFDLGYVNDSGVYSIDASASSTTRTLGVTADGGGGLIWTPMGMDFVATGALTTISLLGSSSGGGQEYIGLDNTDVEFVSLAAATPLPAALPMFAGGAGLIGFIASRRKRRAA